MRMERDQNTVTIYMDGELDHCSAQGIRRVLDGCLQDGQVKNMILDMEDITFMDSSGIGVILGRYKMLRQRGGKLSVRNMNAQVSKVFRLSGMHQIIDIV